ncbi:hypothetical protein D5086_027128 [Populus alba]|uniref:Uncharacterized protein n=1 Tax=Populus alba TaxID=43335 RepID=A0ACC4B3Q1_POPAL
MSATSSVSDSYSFVRVLGMVGYKDLLRSFVEDDSGSQVEYAPLAMGSFLVENLQCVLVDSSLSKDDHASGLYLSGMELIYAFINWVATPYRVQLQISLIRVNSTVRPRFAHSVEGAQVSDIANFSGLTSSTANSAKVLRLCAKKAILLVSLCCVAMFAIEELHRAHHCGVYKVAPIPNILETITVEDYSSEEGSEENLSKEEQLYFSFIDDDGEDMLTSTPWASPPAGLIPPPTSEGCSTPTEDIGGGTPTTKAIVGSFIDPVETVIQDAELGPCVASDGWITVEPRQKSNKHTRGNTKGKEVITTEVMPDMNTSTKLSPPVNVNVFASLDA